MTLSGEQWLDQVLRPTLAAVNHDRHGLPADVLRSLGSRLAAQVEALGDTGVLTDEQESAAVAALTESGIMPETRLASAWASTSSGIATAITAVRAGSAPPPAVSPTPPGPPQLVGVLPGPRVLGELDGRPVTLISAELWSDRFIIDLCADPGPEHRASRMRDTREELEWMKRQRRGEAVARPSRTILTSPLRAITWELRDEHATQYSRGGGSGESGDYLDRLRLSWHPPPAPDIEHVTLVATDAHGTVVLTAPIPVG